MTKRRSLFGRFALGAAGLLILAAFPGEKAWAQTPYWVADGPGSHRACGMYFKSNSVGPGRYQATNVPSAACNRLGYGNVYAWSRVGNRSVTLWDRFGRRMRTFRRMPGYPGYFRSGRLVFRPANTRWPGVGPGPGPGPRCSTVYRPVCGLRGGRYSTFRNVCWARRAGAVNIRRGRCRGPRPGLFRTFHNPRSRGFILDHCWTWGKSCGRPAANAFCRRRGYARAASFRTYRPGRTRVYRTGQICRGPFCTGYRWIRCRRR